MPQHTGLYQAQTLELRGRKRREGDHAHFIVTLRFLRQSRGRQLETGSLSEGALPLLLLNAEKDKAKISTKQQIM